MCPGQGRPTAGGRRHSRAAAGLWAAGPSSGLALTLSEDGDVQGGGGTGTLEGPIPAPELGLILEGEVGVPETSGPASPQTRAPWVPATPSIHRAPER